MGALDDVRLAGAAADRSGGAGSSGLSRPLELLELIGEPLEPLEPCCVDTSDALGDARGFTGRVSSLPSSCDGQCWILEGDAGDEGRSIRGAAAILRNVSEFSKSCRSKPLLEICRFSHSASSSVTAFRGGVGASVLSGLTSTFTFRRPLRPLRPQRHARQQHPKPKREPRMDGSRMDPSALPGPSPATWLGVKVTVASIRHWHSRSVSGGIPPHSPGGTERQTASLRCKPWPLQGSEAALQLDQLEICHPQAGGLGMPSGQGSWLRGLAPLQKPSASRAAKSETRAHQTARDLRGISKLLQTAPPAQSPQRDATNTDSTRSAEGMVKRKDTFSRAVRP